MALVLAFGLHCGARQIRNEAELEEATQRAAAGKESGWRALERTIKNEEKDPDVEMQKRALAEVGKIPSPRSETLLSENLTHRHLRAEAFEGLLQQRNENNKAQIDAKLLEAARHNAREYGTLTREEIRALGEIDHPDAVRLLREQLGQDPAKDELVIESLGKILRRKKVSQIPFPFFFLLGQAESQLQVEQLFSAPEAIPEGTKATTSEDDPEKVLLDFLGSNAAPEIKDKAVEQILAAHGNDRNYLIARIQDSSLHKEARIAIIDYLTRYAVDKKEVGLIGTFRALERRVDNAEVRASLALSVRILEQAFGVATRPPRKMVHASPLHSTKEPDIITLRERPYPRYSADDVRTNFKKMLRHYGLSSALLERMEKRVRDLIALPQNQKSSERNLIFAALGRLYPDKDFYVLKKHAHDAFNKPGYFTTTLRLLTASARPRSWQIAVLQRLWGLSYNEADLLRQIYLRDGRLLVQRLRL
ncbi:MAG: hypothetical protein N2Z22_03230 [Turneriella sp.]|nr:hypothetical protein [Turneriella sp.]